MTDMIRTSQTHPLQINAVSTPAGEGKIGITFCPGKKQHDAMTGIWERDLETDLKCIIDWGASVLVTLVEQHEIESLCVTGLPGLVESLGIEWYHLPIKDRSIPNASFEERWVSVSPYLRQLLNEGKRIVLHCKGGLGRAGTIAARILVELGEDPDVAIENVRDARPGAIETKDQEVYVGHSPVILDGELFIVAGTNRLSYSLFENEPTEKSFEWARQEDHDGKIAKETKDLLKEHGLEDWDKDCM